MATQIKHRRGTQSEVDAFTPAIGEIIMNTSENELVLGDGVTQGGVGIPKKNSVTLSLDTLAIAKAIVNIKAGYSIELKEDSTGNGDGATWDVVAGQALTVGDGVVNHDTLNLQLVRRDNTRVENRINSTLSSVKTKVFSPQKALFAFHFDGPYISNLTSLLDSADALGVPVCIGSIVDQTNGAYGGTNEDAGQAYTDQLIDAVNRGHEIYNHGFSGAADMSPGSNVADGVLEEWVNGSYEWLQNLGITPQMWVTSNGLPVTDQTSHLDTDYIPKILENHSVVFGRTSSPWNDANGFLGASFGADTLVNQEGLTRANIEGTLTTPAVIEEFIDYCITHNRVAVFAGHDSGDATKVDIAKFEALVNMIHSKGYEVVNSQDVFSSFTNLFSDNAQSAKGSNKAGVKANSFVQENLLPSTDLTYTPTWQQVASASFGAYTITSVGDTRQEGEQFALVVSDPTVLNETLNFQEFINRPFNTDDAEMLALTIGFASSSTADFGVQCSIQFFTGLNGSGSSIKTFSLGGTQSISTINQELTAIATNLFAYNDAQSIKVRFEIANKTTWVGDRTLNLFNPRLNRGFKPAVFSKKAPAKEQLWRGNVNGVASTITLDRPATDGSFIQIEVGPNNTNNDVRGSVMMSYNVHDNREVTAFSSGGSPNTVFTLRFNSPTEIEILAEVITGGGDFAVIGVYKY